MSFDFSTLVTDRSQADLDTLRALLAVPLADWTAEQLAEFNRAVSKGSYNYTDLNRVIAAMDDINERLTAAGYVTGYQRIQIHEAPAPEPPPDPEDVTLPEGYARLEYIQSSGTQYIDTGIRPNQDTAFRLKFAMTDISADYAMFGCRDTTSSGMFMALNRSDTFRISLAASIGSFAAYTADATQVTDLTLSHGAVTIGGTTEAVSSDPFQCGYNCLLFAASNGGTPAWQAPMKLYGCAIYDGSTLTRNYVPCKDPSGEVGLYDGVTQQFYGNSGTGNFIAGPLAELPDGYTELAYIESTGTQYIDTGVTPNQDTALAGSFMVKSTANAAAGTGFIPYGAAYTYNSQAFELYTTSGQFEINYDGQANFIGTVQMDQKIHVNHDKNIVSIILQDGTSVNTAFTYQNFTAPYTLTLFAINRGSAACGLLRLYSCKIYDNGTLVRDFVPCTDASGSVGLYDRMNGVFYQNLGTGAFIAGPEPGALPDGYTELEYIESSGSQYINTHVIPTDPRFDIAVDFQGLLAAYNKYIISFYDSGSSQLRAGYSSETEFFTGGGFNYSQAEDIFVRTVATTNGSSNSVTAQYELYLFCQNLRGSAQNNTYISARLYRCTIAYAGCVLRDFVPCKNDSNEIGLFDLSRGMFYGNDGTGSFAAGPEVQPVPDPEPEPVLEPYTWYESDTPTQAQMTQYLANVEALKGALTLADNAPELPPDMDGLTTQEANHIEEILAMINLYLLALQKVFLRSGMAWAVSGGPRFYFAN